MDPPPLRRGRHPSHYKDGRHDQGRQHLVALVFPQHPCSKQDFHRDHPRKVLTGSPPVAKTARLVAVLLAASHVSKRCVAATALEAP